MTLTPTKPVSFWSSYEKISLLGRGLYGKVYKAKHRVSGHFVAAKKTVFDATGVPATTLREITSLKEISGHPNIVS
jgi:serine/threonine protein kinase